MPDYMGLTRRRYDLDNVAPLSLDGHPLDWYGADPSDGWLQIDSVDIATSFQQVPGRSGGIDMTLEDETGAAAIGRLSISLGIVISGDEQQAVESKLRIGTLIGRDVTVKWRALPGEYHGRLSRDAWSDIHLGPVFFQSTTTLTISADPFLRYPRQTIPLLDGEDAFLFTVPGNRPTRPRFTLTPTAGVERVLIRDNGERAMTVKLPAAADGDRPLVVDAETRTLRFGSALAGLTLDSDWFNLTPGRHSITIGREPAADGRTLSSGWLSFVPMGLI